MGEEWRRGWHPEKVNLSSQRDSVLIVGAGPAGLEAALTLGRRGVPVMLADANDKLGGRINAESRLPGLAEWARVRDWRLHQISKLSHVELFPGSHMSAADCEATGAKHVIVATGSHWRRDGRGLSFPAGIAGYDDPRTLTPDEIMAGKRGAGDVVVFDDDSYYMAASLAELLALEGRSVTCVAAQGRVGSWMEHTVEQERLQARLITLGVKIIVNTTVSGLTEAGAELACVFTDQRRQIDCGTLIPVTSRAPDDALWQALQGRNFASLTRIGDCKAPGIIAQAVHDGHRVARAFGEAEQIVLRERVVTA
jgi:dimethylamine/trimethylamine dehydrogenase